MCYESELDRCRVSFRSFLSTAMSEQEVPSPVAQFIIIKFLMKKGIKSSEMFTGLKAEFGDAIFSRTQVFDCE